MVKHKKKKSPPTPGPDKSEKKDLPTEKDNEPSKDERVNETPANEGKDYRPPTETPEKTPAEKDEKEAKLNTLFWIRVGLAVVGGILATFLFEPLQGEERRWASIGLLIAIFIGSGIMAKGMRIPLPSSERKKIVTQGIGSYIFIYLFVWIFSYTLLHIGGEGGATSVMSP